MRQILLIIYPLLLFIACAPLSSEKHVITLSNSPKEVVFIPPKGTFEFEINVENIRALVDTIIVYRYYNNKKGNGEVYKIESLGLLCKGDQYDNKLSIKYIPNENLGKSNDKLILEIIFKTNSFGFDKTIYE